jgi:hypothetical protein
LIELVALSLSLIGLMIERDWRIRDYGLQAHAGAEEGYAVGVGGLVR